MNKNTIFDQLEHGLIVSCQALEGEALYSSEGNIMPKMAQAACIGGAAGIRANTVRDIIQIKQAVELPIIGIIKKSYPGTTLYITVTMREVDELVKCGTDIIAVQGTEGLRPDGKGAAVFIAEIRKKYPDQAIMADIATVDEAISCSEAGADFVGSTMRGYTEKTRGISGFDSNFIRELSNGCSAKVIAEGHIHYPEEAVAALKAGAYAIVVGGAITRPAEITERFVSSINDCTEEK